MDPIAITADVAQPPGVRVLGRRAAGVALLAAFGVALLLAVPSLRGLVDPVREMSPGWLALAVVLELASCLSFVVIFRLFFDRLTPRVARPLAWTSMASGALFPGGGAGGLVIGGWVMRATGVPTNWIVRRSSGLFFLTSAASVAALVLAGLVALPGASGAIEVARDGLPVLGGLAAAALVLTLPRLRTRRRSVRALLEGIRDARRELARPSWRLLGAAGYLGFDIAVLWCTLKALGAGPPIAALVLGYTIGYVANTLPVPGGLGVLDGGLAAALILYRVPAEHVAAAVLVYHAIALWLPGLGGLLAYVRLRRRL